MRFEYLFSKNRTVAPLNFPPQKSLISSPSVTRCSQPTKAKRNSDPLAYAAIGGIENSGLTRKYEAAVVPEKAKIQRSLCRTDSLCALKVLTGWCNLV